MERTEPRAQTPDIFEVECEREEMKDVDQTLQIGGWVGLGGLVSDEEAAFTTVFTASMISPPTDDEAEDDLPRVQSDLNTSQPPSSSSLASWRSDSLATAQPIGCAV